LFTGVGEEQAEAGGGCFCMIKVDKPLSIESRDGANATVLDANDTGVGVVAIFSSGAVFGKKKKGFTLTGGDDGSGLATGNDTTGITIAANVATGNRFSGFFVHGNGHLVTGNVAERNADGFSLRGGGHVVSGNVARAHSDHGYDVRGAGHRFSANVASANSEHGFNVLDSGHTLNGNVASANGESGFEVGGSGISFTGNSAHANHGAGFSLLGTQLRLTGNSIVANRSNGIFIGAFAGDVQITKSNIFGNSLPDNGSFGVFNAAGQIQATDNFWGAATGPGSDPADDIFDDAVGSQTVFAPFATKPFKVKPLTSLGPAK
jgi:hypothetical protein